MNDDPIQLAGCVLLDDYGRLLLLHRYIGEGQWELPGGKVEKDEEPAAAAVRELHEELGVSVQLARALGGAAFELNGREYHYQWFLGAIVAGEPEAVETDKFDDFDYFEVEDLSSLALSPNMQILYERLMAGEVALEP